jgi:hypothetical protein
VSDFDYAALPTPRFAVLDIVRIGYHGDAGESTNLGTIHEIRYYRDRGYRYAVSGDEGGIVDDAHLAPTGRRDTADTFWQPPLRSGDVVEIAAHYPKEKWRGYFGTVESSVEGLDGVYGIAIALSGALTSRGPKIEYREVNQRYLVPTGECIPAPPVPRPVTTWRANGDKGLRPTHEFSIIDDIDHHL